jgi:glycerate 2-kinase
MTILIAPNAFKNSLSATEAAACLREGLEESLWHGTCLSFPIADGGDGTRELITDRFGGQTVEGIFTGPLGKKTVARFGLIDGGKTAVIEMSDTAGLKLLKSNELNPLLASSRGTGEMMLRALDLGVKKIILTLGGTATVDGGCGILHALGLRFLDNRNNELLPFPEALAKLARVDISGLDSRIPDTTIEVWCDVDNRLLGPAGAAAMFGPQKGASASQIVQLERLLQKLNDLSIQVSGREAASLAFGGAAGGTAAFLHCFLYAGLVQGIDRFLEISGFEKQLDLADLVITGEGEIDLQTLQGKGPAGVASRARKKNIPVIGVAGKIPLTRPQGFSELFTALFSIGNQPMSVEESIRLTRPNLVRTGKEIGNLVSLAVR